MFHNIRLHRVRKQIIVIVSISVLLVSLAEIWSVNRLATLGVQISKMEQTKMNLQLENQILETQIAAKSALNKNRDAAKKLGFEEIKTIKYLKELNLASK